MAQLTLAEHLRALEVEMREWIRPGMPDIHIMLDHWATRLAALVVMAERR
jgi:hypothetical protein